MSDIRIVSKDVKKAKGKIVFKHNLRTKNVSIKILVDSKMQIPEKMPDIVVVDSNTVTLSLKPDDVIGFWHITAQKEEKNVNKR